MKGTIINCVGELVCQRFGDDKWAEILERSGLEGDVKFMYTCDVGDRTVFRILDNSCAVLGISVAEVADAFGDHWINVYAGRIYKSYFAHLASFEDFIKGLDSIHARVTSDIPNARPPRFEVFDVEPGVLRLNYISDRALVDFAAGLVRGVGRYFDIDVDVSVLSNGEIEVRIHE
ncbi:MAG: heme NO-binding domain-containing protein [Acidobacteriota bacterium]|nr:heme NO-binding domain-containing protein [Acidobacteriota bacterium]